MLALSTIPEYKIMNPFFKLKAVSLRAGLESDDKGVMPQSRVPQEPIAPANPSVLKKDGVDDEGKADKNFGKDNAFADNEQDLDVIAEQQAAMEAIHVAVIRGNNLKASLEEMADQLDQMVAPTVGDYGVEVPPAEDAGLSPEAAQVLQTSLNASDVEGAGEMVAVESFHFNRTASTKSLARTLRARAQAVGRSVETLRAKVGV